MRLSIPLCYLCLSLPVLAGSPAENPDQAGASLQLAISADAVQETGKFTPPPLYLQVLKSLQTGDTVLPVMPDAHPVSTVYNREAIIPPQCYTRTEGKYNPCYVCHQNEIGERENTMNDGDLQEAYSFSDLGMTNHWQNLFEDRSKRVAAIGDREILAWVNDDNYSGLLQRLEDAAFDGWIPDLKNLQEGPAAFDEFGFAKDGSRWVAYNYKPFPSTFWPTNGSTDDVMVRLPEPFWTDKDGNYSRDVYIANLAAVEANIKGMQEISTPPIDEEKVGMDLNGDKKLTVIHRLTRVGALSGAAEGYLFKPYLYPLGTEFLHTVRYLGINDKGEIVPSRRMKEVRYMRKAFMMPKFVLDQLYREELYEKEQGYLPGYINRGHRGLDNEMGWLIHGFIEDRKGRLRVSTYEENLFCMGCHTSVGATIDKTFSFARKIDGAEGWGYIDLKGMPDAPNIGERKGEFLTYFERVGGGGEFRSNPEMQARWFNKDGSVNAAKVANADVYTLITPSKERALQLNKAYRVIVEDQDYFFGRDATVTPPQNVYDKVDNETSPTLPAEFIYRWDIRLDWQGQSQQAAH